MGVFFSEYNGQAYALDVFEGSSASDAGVLPGDFVVAIDGDRSQEWTSTEVINAVQRVRLARPSSSRGVGLRPSMLRAAMNSPRRSCTDYTEPKM